MYMLEVKTLRSAVAVIDRISMSVSEGQIRFGDKVREAQ